jgi:hypothetical protein
VSEREVAERELRISLQALALPAPEQVRVTKPGCVTCELSQDFAHWSEEYLAHFARTVSSTQRSALQAVAVALEAVPTSDLRCNNDALLQRPSWQQVRFAAQRALSALGWLLEAPPAYVRLSHDVWQRGPR